MSGKNRPPLDIHATTEELLREIRDELKGGGRGGVGGFGFSGTLGKITSVIGSVANAGVAQGAAIDGLVNVSRGGSFGGGVQRSLLEAADAALPSGLSEILGFGQASRTLSGAEGDLNSITNTLARFAGPDAISPQLREFYAENLLEQNKRVQEDSARNAAVIADKSGQAVKAGTVAADLVEFGKAIKEATIAIRGLLGAGPSTAG